MPIRRTLTNYSPDTGEHHYTYCLVANQRTGSEVHRIPLNLSLDRRKCWVEVASDSNSVEPDEDSDQTPDI